MAPRREAKPALSAAYSRDLAAISAKCRSANPWNADHSADWIGLIGWCRASANNLRRPTLSVPAADDHALTARAARLARLTGLARLAGLTAGAGCATCATLAGLTARAAVAAVPAVPSAGSVAASAAVAASTPGPAIPASASGTALAWLAGLAGLPGLAVGTAGGRVAGHAGRTCACAGFVAIGVPLCSHFRFIRSSQAT